MRVVTFNAWVGQEPEDLRSNLLQLCGDLFAPEVIALQEATRFDGTIPGYDRVAASDRGRHRDASSSVLLVRRKGVRIMRATAVRVNGPSWVGPHGTVHPPRVYPAVSLLVHNDRKIGSAERWRVIDVHRTPLRHQNREAWAAEEDALARWAGTPGDSPRPVVMLGDWNGRYSDLRPLAKRTGTSVHLRGIDGALLRNCHGDARRLPERYGSDAHFPVALDLTKETTR